MCVPFLIPTNSRARRELQYHMPPHRKLVSAPGHVRGAVRGPRWGPLPTREAQVPGVRQGTPGGRDAVQGQMSGRLPRGRQGNQKVNEKL